MNDFYEKFGKNYHVGPTGLVIKEDNLEIER